MLARDSRAPASLGESPAGLTALSFDQLRLWIDDDQPVEHPNQDRFGAHDEIAQRIAGRLRAWSIGSPAPTIAVVGPMGSGKSTIRALVQHYLQGDDSLRIADLSLWSFADVEAAVRGILDCVVP